MFLVLPKMQQVADAKKSLAAAQSQQQLLQSQLSALQQAQNDAPKNKADHREVQRQIPPTVDEPGMLLLMVNSATNAGIKLWQFTPATPLPDARHGLTVIPLSFTVKGTYFALGGVPLQRGDAAAGGEGAVDAGRRRHHRDLGIHHDHRVDAADDRHGQLLHDGHQRRSRAPSPGPPTGTSSSTTTGG